MNITHHNPYVFQAWAFASGVRLVLGKNPLMNMENFPHDVWTLHRKLFHRFLKYRKYFLKATKNIADYQKAKEEKPEPKKSAASASSCCSTHHVICLLSSSDEEVSEDDDSEDGTVANV